MVNEQKHNGDLVDARECGPMERGIHHKCNTGERRLRGRARE